MPWRDEVHTAWPAPQQPLAYVAEARLQCVFGGAQHCGALRMSLLHMRVLLWRWIHQADVRIDGSVRHQGLRHNLYHLLHCNG